MKIVLFEPQIPQNAGNIVRTCAVTGSDLIMVKPLGFSITDRWLKRAGLDYWEGVNVQAIEKEELIELLCEGRSNFYFFSSKVPEKYSDVKYEKDDYLIFGSETSGLDPFFQEKWPDKFRTIPMVEGARCLNLATSAGIVVYEAWRQLGFK